MEPSNQTNGQPFIYRIMDAFGVKHQVVPVDHTHRELVGQTVSIVINGNEIEIEPSDIPNILRAMSNPDTVPTANSDKLVTSGGVYLALKNKTSISHEDMDSIVEVEVKHVGDDEYDQTKVIGKTRIVIGVGTDAEDGSVIIDATSITNLQRALQNPDSVPTAGSNHLVTSGGVKAAIDNIMNQSSRQIILTKTADGYQFANAESELEEFVNRITSWTGESVPTLITCVVITNDGTEGMPATLSYALTSRYLDFNINIATYRLEGQIMIDAGTYSSDMLMALTDMSYVFAE